MKPIETNKNAMDEKNPSELRDFKKVGNGSLPSEKKAPSEQIQPVTDPKVESPGKLKL